MLKHATHWPVHCILNAHRKVLCAFVHNECPLVVNNADQDLFPDLISIVDNQRAFIVHICTKHLVMCVLKVKRNIQPR